MNTGLLSTDPRHVAIKLCCQTKTSTNATPANTTFQLVNKMAKLTGKGAAISQGPCSFLNSSRRAKIFGQLSIFKVWSFRTHNIRHRGEGIFFHQYQIKGGGIYWLWPKNPWWGFQPAVYLQTSISHLWGTIKKRWIKLEVTLGWKDRLGHVRWHIPEIAILL